MRPVTRVAALILGLGVAVPLAVTPLRGNTPQDAPRAPLSLSRPVPGVIGPPDDKDRAMAGIRASRSRVLATPKATAHNSFSSPAPSSPRIHARPKHTTIRQQSSSYPINIAIADCESGDRLANGKARHYSYDAHQDNVSSSASGAYQFIDSTWRSASGLPGRATDYSFEIQTRAFWKLWANGAGAHNWYPSRSCWS